MHVSALLGIAVVRCRMNDVTDLDVLQFHVNCISETIQ